MRGHDAMIDGSLGCSICCCFDGNEIGRGILSRNSNGWMDGRWRKENEL